MVKNGVLGSCSLGSNVPTYDMVKLLNTFLEKRVTVGTVRSILNKITNEGQDSLSRNEIALCGNINRMEFDDIMYANDAFPLFRVAAKKGVTKFISRDPCGYDMACDLMEIVAIKGRPTRKDVELALASKRYKGLEFEQKKTAIENLSITNYKEIYGKDLKYLR